MLRVKHQEHPRTAVALAALIGLAQSAAAQNNLPATAPTAPPAAAAAASAPAATPPRQTPAAAPAASASPATPAQRIEINAGRESDADQRRNASAAKIIIGREEIQRFGDSTVSEVLRRLPGVTTGGPAGRPGPPRMRGLGGGYTQILIDGQRAPAGFSLDQLTPEQLERIEILRAPTAETGARAIGGTINIVTREGFKVRLNDVRIGTGIERGKLTPGLFWTHNDSDDNFIYNLTGAVFRPQGVNLGRRTVEDVDLATGRQTRLEESASEFEFKRIGVNLNARLQWRSEAGDMFMLMPGVFANKGQSDGDVNVLRANGVPLPRYATARSDVDNQFASVRVNSQWRTRLPADWRLELSANGNVNNGESTSVQLERNSSGGLLRNEQTDSDSAERNINLNGKLTKVLQGDHSFVGGWELERSTRSETRITTENGIKLLNDFDDTFEASSTRLALYVQDEWKINPKWSANAGLRSETIVTRGEGEGGRQVRNRAHVATPLVHFLYRPDPRVRDQIRISLTRSYRSPTLTNLVARPAISLNWPVSGVNTPTSPDRAGNPDLLPELATGVDVAFERYLPQGGVLSANVFVRQLSNYIRSQTQLETVSWSPVQRYVSRSRNVGDAMTAGIELEAKFPLDQLIAGAPRVEVRSNLSLFHSKVDGIPGPNNRLDQQPKGTLNVGGDYRFRGTPLTVGASLNLTPGFNTQLSALQQVSVNAKRQFDAFALWVFNPNVQLRINASNLAPSDSVNSNQITTDTLRERSVSTTPTAVSWRLGLELKL
jgi:outer membrane receptor for ferrienterochelin and colicins